MLITAIWRSTIIFYEHVISILSFLILSISTCSSLSIHIFRTLKIRTSIEDPFSWGRIISKLITLIHYHTLLGNIYIIGRAYLLTCNFTLLALRAIKWTPWAWACGISTTINGIDLTNITGVCIDIPKRCVYIITSETRWLLLTSLDFRISIIILLASLLST